MSNERSTEHFHGRPVVEAISQFTIAEPQKQVPVIIRGDLAS